MHACMHGIYTWEFSIQRAIISFCSVCISFQLFVCVVLFTCFSAEWVEYSSVSTLYHISTYTQCAIVAYSSSIYSVDILLYTGSIYTHGVVGICVSKRLAIQPIQLSENGCVCVCIYLFHCLCESISIFNIKMHVNTLPYAHHAIENSGYRLWLLCFRCYVRVWLYRAGPRLRLAMTVVVVVVLFILFLTRLRSYLYNVALLLVSVFYSLLFASSLHILPNWLKTSIQCYWNDCTFRAFFVFCIHIYVLHTYISTKLQQILDNRMVATIYRVNRAILVCFNCVNVDTFVCCCAM